VVLVWLSATHHLHPSAPLAEHTDLTPRPITDNWQRQRFFEALASALVAQAQPLMLLLDDLQWCDQATLDFLGFFLRWRTTTPVMVCSKARVEDLDDQPGIGLLLAALRRE